MPTWVLRWDLLAHYMEHLMCSLRTTSIFWIQNAAISQETLCCCVIQSRFPPFIPSVHTFFHSSSESFHVR